ncbi:MAG: hypothetical protein ACI9XU_000045 [Arenicella sp.]|jgi:hypothetical protein
MAYFMIDNIRTTERASLIASPQAYLSWQKLEAGQILARIERVFKNIGNC